MVCETSLQIILLNVIRPVARVPATPTLVNCVQTNVTLPYVSVITQMYAATDTDTDTDTRGRITAGAKARLSDVEALHGLNCFSSPVKARLWGCLG